MPKRPPLRRRGRGAWQAASVRRQLRRIPPQCLGPRRLAALFEEARARADEVRPGIAEEIAKELTFLTGSWPRDLRAASSTPIFFQTMCCSLAMNCPGLSISTSPARMNSHMMSRSRSMLVFRTGWFLQHHQGIGFF